MKGDVCERLDPQQSRRQNGKIRQLEFIGQILERNELHNKGPETFGKCPLYNLLSNILLSNACIWKNHERSRKEQPDIRTEEYRRVEIMSIPTNQAGQLHN